MRTMRPRLTVPLPEIPSGLRRSLRDLYLRVDSELLSLGPACWAHGDCCDFTARDHRLYASSLEVAYALESRRLPGNANLAHCPFWEGRRCQERARRPLGCRTYFCDRRYEEALGALYERAHALIGALARGHDFPWYYAPFVETLRRMQAPRMPRAGEAATQDATP